MKLSNMFSQSKKLDKEFALHLIGMIEVLVKRGTRLSETKCLDLAEKFGELYLANEQKLQTKDYSFEDQFQKEWLDEYHYENSI